MLKIHLTILRPGALGTLVLLVVCGLSGCHRKAQWPIPKTYPVTGKVVVSQGQIPVGATIEFRPKNVELAADGLIAADGSFSLTILFHEQRLPGATEGLHQVLVRQHLGDTIVLNESYTIEPKENHFIVKLDTPPVPKVRDALHH